MINKWIVYLQRKQYFKYYVLQKLIIYKVYDHCKRFFTYHLVIYLWKGSLINKMCQQNQSQTIKCPQKDTKSYKQLILVTIFFYW